MYGPGFGGGIPLSVYHSLTVQETWKRNISKSTKRWWNIKRISYSNSRPRPSILSSGGKGPSSGVNVSPIDVILNDDVAANDTPIVPAGAYDYGSGKVYTAFTTEDVVEGGTKRVTRGLWSGGSGELTVFHTSSFLSNTQKSYYYEVYNGLPSVSTNEPQFSIIRTLR